MRYPLAAESASDVGRVHTRILLSHKERNAVCSNLDRPRNYHISAVSQRETQVSSDMTPMEI